MKMQALLEFRPWCSHCHKRPATRLCDFPIGRAKYIGHPPRSQMLQSQMNNVAFSEVKLSRTITCDKPLCDECAVKVGSEIDLCPTHKEVFIKHKE